MISKKFEISKYSSEDIELIVASERLPEPARQFVFAFAQKKGVSMRGRKKTTGTGLKFIQVLFDIALDIFKHEYIVVNYVR